MRISYSGEQYHLSLKTDELNDLIKALGPEDQKELKKIFFDLLAGGRQEINNDLNLLANGFPLPRVKESKSV